MKADEGEICVLGGGPAGSVIARSLAELGHDVLLIDRTARENGPRGESLAPSIVPILDSLRLRSAVDAAVFCREKQALVLWGSGDVAVKSFGASPSLLVERAMLDDRLRTAASRAAVRIVSPAKARAVRHLSGGEWLIPVATSDGPMVVKSRFLVDARGKRHRMCIDDGASRTVALSAPWTSGDQAFAETRIEAGNDEWFWGSPLPDGSYAAAIFLDSARVAGFHADGRREFYRDVLSRSKLLKDLMRGKMIGPVCVRDATPRVSKDPIGNDFIRVGEASVSIDPLSSQGIQTALLSAIQASAAVHTILTEGCDPGAARAFYRERQQAAAARSRLTAARLYRQHRVQSSFWMHRSLAADGAAVDVQPQAPITGASPSRPRVDQSLQSLQFDHSFQSDHPLQLDHALQIVDVPVLSGAFIRRAPALCHPRLEQPVAYFSGVALAPLVREADGASTADEILRRWTRRMPPEAAWNIMTWMCAVGILIPPSSARRPRTRLVADDAASFRA
jgi:flavin-dependent dehydrogenase